jgi:hypothetical protein
MGRKGDCEGDEAELWLATSRRAARNETDLRRVGFVFPGIAMHVELQVLR